jgi:DNA-directed RNA polymerase subunit N (RpoN/RPB10)
MDEIKTSIISKVLVNRSFPSGEIIFSFLYFTRICCQRIIILFSKEIDKLVKGLYIILVS